MAKKKSAEVKPERQIEVTLKFSEKALNRILAACWMGDEGKEPKVADMTADQFAQLTNELQTTAPAFVEEIVDGSEDDSDWLMGFLEQFEEQ